MRHLRTRLALLLAPWLKPQMPPTAQTVVFDHLKGHTYTTSFNPGTVFYFNWKDTA